MDRFINAGFSLLDYDGDLSGFLRNGKGKQDWPGFCSISGRWSQNKLSGNGKLSFKHFPLDIFGEFRDNILSDVNMTMGEGELKLDVKVNRDFFIESGIIALEKNHEFHFKIANSKIETYVLKHNGEILNIDQYIKDGVLEYPLNPQKSLFFGFNVQSLTVELYSMDPNKQRFDDCHQIHLRTNCFAIFSYEQGRMVGLQQVLDLGKNLPSVKRYWLENEQEEEDIIYLANGSVMTNKAGDIRAKLIYKGVDSYMMGQKRDDKLRGTVDIFIDGKYTIQADMRDEGLLFTEPQKLFKTIDNVKDQTLDEHDDNLLNGYSKYEYSNGIVYEGFFLNDFIYCHKDSLLSCLNNINKPRHLDLEAFLLKVSSFEGVVQNGKIFGKAKVKYKNSTLYEGFYDEYFLKTGNAVEFASNGELYSGEFKNDTFNGLGKLFRPDVPLEIGIFEDNKIKLRFDMDNLDQTLIDKLKADIVKEKTVTEQKIKELVEQKKFVPAENEENARREREAKMQQMIEEERNKKIEEANRMVRELQKKIVVVKIFSFKNGFAYHGKIKGDTIVDGERGDIIDPEGNRIPVLYRYIKELGLGSFRSINKKFVFIYKLETKEIAKIELNREAENVAEEENPFTFIRSVIRSQISAQDDVVSKDTVYEDEDSKEKTKEAVSDHDGVSNLVVHEDTNEANLESNVYLEDEKLNESQKEGGFTEEVHVDFTVSPPIDHQIGKDAFLKNKFSTIVEDPIENESAINQSTIRNDYYKDTINSFKGLNSDAPEGFKSFNKNG